METISSLPVLHPEVAWARFEYPHLNQIGPWFRSTKGSNRKYMVFGAPQSGDQVLVGPVLTLVTYKPE